MEGHTHGEWFWDRGVTTQWLIDMTQGEPICRHVWALVPGTEVFWDWSETTRVTLEACLERDGSRVGAAVRAA